MDTSTTQDVAAIVVVAKNAGYIAAFAAGMQFLGIIPMTAIALICLIITDMITGVLKAGYLHGGAAIKSSIFERGLMAKVLLLVIPVNIALAGKGIGIDLSTIAQGTITTLVLSELYSIFGNIYAIHIGVENKVEFDAVAFLLRSLNKLLKAFIQD